MKSEREKVAARIRALAAKTVENGCTEDEAIAAAAKLVEMLSRYNMTLDEAMMRESPFTTSRNVYADEIGDRLWKVAKAISELTDTRYWTSPAGVNPVQITFFGFEHEVEAAKYLLAICRRAMTCKRDDLMLRYGLLVQARRRMKMLPYFDGMADSLARRIRALKPPTPTGTGLIVLHRELIDAAMPVKLRDHKQRASRDFEDTYAEGWRAGERVPLNRGVGSNRTDSLRLR